METIQTIIGEIRQAAEVLLRTPNDQSALQHLDKVISKAIGALENLSRGISSPENLNQVIEYTENVLSVVPNEHASRAAFLSSLCGMLHKRFSMMEPHGNPDDLNTAVQLADQWVSATRPRTLQRLEALVNLSKFLRSRYDHTRVENDIVQAVAIGEQAVEILPRDAEFAAEILRNLAISRGKLFERTHVLADAARAIETAESAVEAAKSHNDDMGVAIGSNTLARILGRRSEQTGSTEDLDRAIDLLAVNVPFIRKTKMDHVVGLSYLATLLGIRFEQQGDVNDLNASIQYTEEVLQLMESDSRDYGDDQLVQRSNLATRLAERSEYNNEPSDLDVAIDYARDVVSYAPKNHPERTTWLMGLSRFLGMRFRLRHNKIDVEEAIRLNRQAVNEVEDGDMLSRVSLANGLSNLLKEKYERAQEGCEKDKEAIGLDEAIDTLRSVLQGDLSMHSPDRGVLELGLGEVLRLRFGHRGNTKDLEESRDAYERAWNSKHSPLTIRINAASQAANILAEWSEDDPSLWSQVSTNLDNAVSLLHALSPRYMQNVNKARTLQNFAGLGAHAAAAALNAGKEASYALQQLEVGRGVINGLLLDLRTDLSLLRDHRTDLADQLSTLRNVLDSANNVPASTGSWESSAQARRRAEKDLESLLTTIRREEGFGRFLMPPAVSELMEAADPDPAVVVNVSSIRCDAFIVTKERISLLELPQLELEDIKANAKQLHDRPESLPYVLEWLWSSAVHPILNKLGYNHPLNLQDDSWPHVWWIPVGPLCSLPLHAAGLHTKRSGETALDRVMSSYSSTLKSLLAGRRRGMRQHDKSDPANALLVAMASTPNRSSLRYAESEVTMLEKLCQELNAKPIKPIQRKADVLAELTRCDMFHFAGHGMTHASDPSRSTLLLRDWERDPLTVEDLRNARLQDSKPFLAYLSACSSGANEVLGLVDEGIHLGYACQLAGFRHTIGTLWTVSDSFCVEVARKFYETIRDEGKTDAAVHRGLHLALRALRDIQVSRGFDSHLLQAGMMPDDKQEKDDHDRHSGNDAGHAGQREKSRQGKGRTQPCMNSLWVPFVHFGV